MVLLLIDRFLLPVLEFLIVKPSFVENMEDASPWKMEIKY